MSALNPSLEAQFRQLMTDYQVAPAVSVAARLGIIDLLACGPQRSDSLAEAWARTHVPCFGFCAHS